MDRAQAVNIIKEILETCRVIEGRSITLLPPKDNDKLSNTFQIHIRTTDEPLKECIKEIAAKHGLATQQEENYFVVYKPYPETKKK